MSLITLVTLPFVKKIYNQATDLGKHQILEAAGISVMLLALFAVNQII